MTSVQSVGVLSMLTVLLVAAGCTDSSAPATGAAESTAQETALEHAAKHLDPKYVCPMHPQIIRDEPGSCPLCGMALVQKQTAAKADQGERKILYYRHPHNPSITSPEPRQDEMGMAYVPIYDDGGGTSVQISPAVENNLGVRTAPVERNRLWRRIDTVGYVDFDENKIAHIHLRTQGWIEKLMVKSEGERVQRGDLLFRYYSPELVNAQEEFLQALKIGNDALIRASRERLRALGVSGGQVKRLVRTRRTEQYVSVYAPQNGIVSMLKVREGMFVQPAMEVMGLADLSSVWLLAEVFESQADWVKVGQPADVKLSYLPGKVWEGKVEYIYPSLDPKTRTLKARLRFDNPDEALKPNMYADIAIYAGPKQDVLAIPQAALIRTGSEQRVILAVGDGRYQARSVVAGIESGDWVEIVAGLETGDRVVTSGQFLIDSEASLKASIARMSDPAAATPSHAPKPDPEPGRPMRDASPTPALEQDVRGTGRIDTVMAAQNKIKLAHDPIPVLQWSAMTMDFEVADDVDLKKLKAGTRVSFSLKAAAQGKGYIITAIRPLADEAAP